MNGKRAIVKSNRSRRVKGQDGVYEAVPVLAGARVLQEEQIARLARVLTVRRASRPTAALSGAVSHRVTKERGQGRCKS